MHNMRVRKLFGGHKCRLQLLETDMRHNETLSDISVWSSNDRLWRSVKLLDNIGETLSVIIIVTNINLFLLSSYLQVCALNSQNYAS
jgi:hypothetical protein